MTDPGLAGDVHISKVVVDFDLLDPCTRRQADDKWNELRDLAPCAWTSRNGGAWLLSRYDEVCDAFRDWETFSSARTDPQRSSVSVAQGAVPLLIPEEIDPPEWHSLRRVLAELLSPRASEALRPRIRYWCSRFLDEIIQDGHCDLIENLAVPVPMAVTMEFLGFPEEEWARFTKAFHDVSAFPPGHHRRQAGMRMFGEVTDAITREIDLRQMQPERDDALGRILRRAVSNGISREMLEGLAFMVMGGGVDTTAALASAAFVHLGHDRDLRARLVRDRSLVPSATEEFLRVYPPARTHTRTVVRDVDVGGCRLEAGDRVVLSEVSANQDERAFPDAAAFKVDRTPNRHVSFGMGIHRCPGSHLARIEFIEMLNAVLDRMPDYEFEGDGPSEYPSWAMVGGWSSIPVSFTPGAPLADRQRTGHPHDPAEGM